MSNYEYTVQEQPTSGGRTENAEKTAWLNEKMGINGWELVAVIPLSQQHNEKSLFIFKRPYALSK